MQKKTMSNWAAVATCEKCSLRTLPHSLQARTNLGLSQNEIALIVKTKQHASVPAAGKCRKIVVGVTCGRAAGSLHFLERLIAPPKSPVIYQNPADDCRINQFFPILRSTADSESKRSREAVEKLSGAHVDFYELVHPDYLPRQDCSFLSFMEPQTHSTFSR